MKLTIQELHYISIIVDSIIDGEDLLSNNIPSRKNIDNFVKDWIKTYKEKNRIKEMTKNDFLKISDICIEKYYS